MHSPNSRMILLGLPGTVALFSHFALAAPLNDNFSDAFPINGASGSLPLGSAWTNNSEATREVNEPFPAGATSGNSVWYRWTAPATGTWGFEAGGPGFNPVLGVYTGSVVASLIEIAASNDSNNNTKSVSFAATAGTTYYIDVASIGGQKNPFFLQWSGEIQAATYTLGGRIIDASGKPVPNVPVALSGPQSVSVITDANGYYTRSSLQSGNYTVTPTANNLTFNPVSRVIDLSDSNSAVNFSATVKPSISVSNVTVVEGNSGTVNAVFTVKLSKTSASPVTVDYATQDGTAVSPNDYVPASGTLHFAPGETSKTVSVLVNGDTLDEDNERFNLNLDAPTNAIISSGQGVGTITDDDLAPVISVGNAETVEGDSGTKTLNFTVGLSAPSEKIVTVSAGTLTTTATATTDPAIPGTDYVAVPPKTLTFAPGETSKTVSVTINGDTVNEQDETFNLSIGGVTNATLGTSKGVGTIINDDATPGISISDVQVTEGNIGVITSASFTVSLSSASSRTVKVTIATADATATAVADYNPVPATVLTFSPGQTSKVVNVLVKGDLVLESTETFNVLLTDAVNATITKSSGTGTIIDNDPEPTITATAPSVTEGNSGTVALPFVLKLSNPSSVPVSVDVRTTAAAVDSAAADIDYIPLTSTIIFAPGETSKTVPVVVKGDLINEVNEKVALVLSNPTGATLGTTSVDGTIANDDALPGLSIDGATISEGDNGTKTLDFTVNLSIPSGKTVTVSAKTLSTTATATTDPATVGTDYVALPTTLLTFAPGETSKTVSVTINGDTANEQDETFNVSIGGATNATIIKASGTGTITNDDATPTFSISDVEVTEGNAGTLNAAFTVSLSAASGKIVKVAAATVDGTAIAGSDYTALPPTLLTFTPGQTSKVINVPIKGDLVREDTETFNVQLTDAVNAGFVKSTGVGSIQDNDPKPTITVTAPSVVEGNSGTITLPFVFKLSNPSSDPINFTARTVNATASAATAGTDYEPLAETFFVFAPGQTTLTVPITINADLIDEDNEKVALALAGAANATLATTSVEGTIIDDDALPTLSIDGATISEGDSGTKTLDFTVSLSAPSGKTVTAIFKTANPAPGTYAATAGTDYVAVPGATVTFAPGETSKKVSVTINGDETFELDEKFNGTLSTAVNATIAQATAVATITNDDLPPEVSIDLANQDIFVAEGNSGTKTVPVTIKLSAPSTQPVVVNYVTQDVNATAGEDYIAQNSSLTFAPGQTSKIINVLVKGDTQIENNEQFALFLTYAAGAILNNNIGHSWYSYVNIVDDDATPSISIDNPTIEEGNSGTKTLNFTVNLSNPSGKTVTAKFKTVASTTEPTYPNIPPFYPATEGEDYVAVPLTTLSFAPGETSKKVSVTINGDELYEFNEYFSGVLSNPTNATIAQGTGLAIINNDDPQETQWPTVAVDPASQQIFVNEGDSGTKKVKVKINLSAPRNYPITVNYYLDQGNAIAGQDFVADQGIITFAPGETTKEIEVKVIGDTIVEPEEVFALLLQGGLVDYNAQNWLSRVVIKDDDSPTLSIDSPEISEGQSGTKTLNFTVSLSVAKETPVSVDFKTGPATLQPWMPPNIGLAKAGEDYVAVPTTKLTFAPGETSKTVSVTINGDELYEFNEQFNGELSNPVNAAIEQGSGVATITNDDPYPSIPPSLSIAAQTNVFEGNSGTKTAKVVVTLSKVSGVPVSVQYSLGTINATFDEDFVPVSGMLVFEPGETSKDIEVPIKGDTTPEPDESIYFYLFSPQAAILERDFGIVTILDDDNLPTLSIDSPTIEEGNSGTKTLDFTISLSKPFSETVTTTFQTGDYTPTPGTYEPFPIYPATADEDYVAVPPTTISFAPGETSKKVSVTINSDELYEWNEYFAGVLSDPVNATLGQATGKATIANDDPQEAELPTIRFNPAVHQLSIQEGDFGTRMGRVPVQLSSPRNYPITVNYRLNANTATEGEDFVAAQGTLTFAPGETSKDIEFTIKSDTIPEANETFAIFLEGALVDTNGHNWFSEISIQDDDSPKLSIDNPTIVEGNSGTSTLNFTVALSYPKQAPVTVDFKTGPATTSPQFPFNYPATAGEDYVAVPTTKLTFNPGDTRKTVSVTINGDNLFELNEQFNGELSNPTNAIIDQGTGVATITNDDNESFRPYVSIAEETNIYEGDSGTKIVKVPLTLSQAVGVPVKVSFGLDGASAQFGSDFEMYVNGVMTPYNGTVTFAPGETTKDIEVIIKGDTDPESNEYFSVYLLNAPWANIVGQVGRVNILDDDAISRVFISSPTIGEGNEGSQNPAVFFVTLNHASTQPVTVTFQTGNYTPVPGTADSVAYYPATAGEDYVAVPPTTVTFNPGETFKGIPVTIKGDSLYELNERFTGLLSNPTNAIIGQGTGVATITNDDAKVIPSIFIPNTYTVVSEGNSGTTIVKVRVILSQAVGVPVSVQYSTSDMNATAGEDYKAATGTLIFAPGETSKDIEFTIYGDTNVENNELFSVSLQSPQNATLNGGGSAVVILNDDNDGSSARSTNQGASAKRAKVSGGES